jgi:hypothetical protein
VPFVRFSRDRRGYEHIYLVHASNRRGKPSRPRVLYWFRTPPGVKVGRKPFDVDVRRALEAQNPDVTFEWDKIVATPMPPADVEHWRERRRADRAAKQARAEEALTQERDDDFPDELDLPPESVEAQEPSAAESSVRDEPPAAAGGGPDSEKSAASAERRRRRRGGRRRRRPQVPAVSAGSTTAEGFPPAASKSEQNASEMADSPPDTSKEGQ